MIRLNHKKLLRRLRNWATHEATHQLNNEAAHFELSQWLDEGMACYISSSVIDDNSLLLSEVDMDTYPAW